MTTAKCPITETPVREGYRTTMYMETVDPEGNRMSDTTQNWYGREDAESNLMHNTMATDILKAINDVVKLWSVEKAALSGVDPDNMQKMHETRKLILDAIKD